MYLRIDETTDGAETPADAAGGAAAGAVEGWQLRGLTAPARVTLALHTTAGPDGTGYEVRFDERGAGAGQPPAFAYLVRFDGPRDAMHSRAEELDARLRIWPAIRGIPGLVRLLAAVGPDCSVIAVGLASTAAAADRAMSAARRAPLRPDQDRALLRAPDRVDVYAADPLTAQQLAPR